MNFALLTAVLVAAIAYCLAAFLGLTKKVEYNDSRCYLLPNISPDSEDIAVVDDTLALVSAGDLDRILFRSNKPARPGAVFAIRFDQEDDGVGAVRSEKVPIEGFPDNAPFNPHGIHYSNTTKRLYAVSHECGERASETIEVFRLVRDSGDNGDNGDEATTTTTASLKLVHERSLRSPSFPLGSLNDLTEGTRLGELYVTVWLPRPMHERCVGHETALDSMLTHIDAMFREKCKVLRCIWDAEKDDDDADAAEEVQCDVAAEGFQMANGIASDPEKKRFYVVDPTAQKLHVFRREENGKLSSIDVVHLPHVGDNVEFDVASGKLTLAANALLYQILSRMGGDGSVEVSGGMVTVEPLQNGSYAVEEVLMHDGSKLSMISSAVFAHDKILLGSPGADGVLVCPVGS